MTDEEELKTYDKGRVDTEWVEAAVRLEEEYKHKMTELHNIKIKGQKPTKRMDPWSDEEEEAEPAEETYDSEDNETIHEAEFLRHSKRHAS